MAISSAVVGRRHKPAGLAAAEDQRAMEAGYSEEDGVRSADVGRRDCRVEMCEEVSLERVVGEGWAREPIFDGMVGRLGTLVWC